MCGGTTADERRAIEGEGLSPRVRGNPLHAKPCRLAYRSIPTCAGEPSVQTERALTHTVYPRVCGGTYSTTTRRRVFWGLSPRVRGNHFGKLVGIGRQRSIPACAGEPSLRTISRRSAAVYPRVCGGTSVPALAPVVPTGLSPRVRGNLYPNGCCCDCFRSIPACAGEP